MFLHYAKKACDLLMETAEKQEQQALTAAKWIAASVQKGGVIHVFGCGHSHILAEELFYRAGGLACISPVLLEDLMLHRGAVRSSVLERQNGGVDSLLADFDIRPPDVLIVVSTSGVNPVPVDVLLFGRRKGVQTIAITSAAYAEKATPRHQDSIKLPDAANLVIDNGAPYGDAILTHEKAAASFSPVSTVIGTALLNGVIAAAIEQMIENGFNPPIFLSGNLPGADEHNRKLIERYESRVPLLR